MWWNVFWDWHLVHFCPVFKSKSNRVMMAHIQWLHEKAKRQTLIMNSDDWSGEWTAVSKRTHTAAQHDQLDRDGEVTPIVVVLYGRWGGEGSLGREQRRWEKRKSLYLSLFLKACCINPAISAYTGLCLPPFHGSTGCMHLTAEDSHCTDTNADNSAEQLYSQSQTRHTHHPKQHQILWNKVLLCL